MKKSLFLLLLAGMLPWLLAPAPARAQAAAPSGQALIARMKQAFNSKGSAHLHTDMTVRVPGVFRVLVHADGDVALRPRRIRERVQSGSTGSGSQGLPLFGQRQTVVVVGRRAALRTDQQPWQCGRVKRLLGQYIDVNSILNPQVTNAVNLGAQSLAGTPVWHVRATVTVTLLGQTAPTQQDLLISRRDNTLLQATATPVITFQGLRTRDTIVQRMSQYGEPVHIQLPAACRA